MINSFTNLLNLIKMAKTTKTTTKMKTCTISGKKYKATAENFYMNRNTDDGLHPYHKKFDNFRRTNPVSTVELRKLVNLINKK